MPGKKTFPAFGIAGCRAQVSRKLGFLQIFGQKAWRGEEMGISCVLTRDVPPPVSKAAPRWGHRKEWQLRVERGKGGTYGEHFSPMSTKSNTPKEPEHTFESAVERLEGIVDAMESDKMPLEELLVRYEEGINLVKTCQQKLESAEKRIEIITRNAAGKPQTASFDPSSASTPPKVATKKTEESDEVSLF